MEKKTLYFTYFAQMNTWDPAKNSWGNSTTQAKTQQII